MEPLQSTDEQVRLIRAHEKTVKWPHDMLLDATTQHIALPDVHVDDASRKIHMYYHWLDSFGV
jgi:hypothetical protein